MGSVSNAQDPRPGESDGVDYHFVTREQMERDIASARFIEYAQALPTPACKSDVKD